MSSASVNLSLPFIQANQAQKHVTHNESLQILDALTQISLVSTVLTEPPADPAVGDCFVVAAPASGIWAGQDGNIAYLSEAGWAHFTPKPGWTAWDQATGQQIVFDGSEWGGVAGLPGSVEQLGINAGADDTNRLVVAADAILATHDSGGDHQLKVNKADVGNTGSLMFQTGYSGRAEMGIVGSDDFVIKTSADGASFHTALQADAATGEVSFPNGARGLTDPDFGAPDLVTKDYLIARGLDLVTNGTGFLGNDYNFPDDFEFDGSVSPNLPGALRFTGRHVGVRTMTELLPVNPNQVYRFGCYLRQEALAGDWSGFENGDRHRQYLGLLAFDVDGNLITSRYHMRHRHNGVDSLTTLAAPLSPGDTVIEVADASGWNISAAAHYVRGVIIFGYRNSLGGFYDHYSQLVEFDLFDIGGVDPVNNRITLKTPLPASLANPDDPSGTWPVGTRLANSSSGDNYKYSVFKRFVPEQSDTWFEMTNHVGGIDLSGRNILANFTPGTAFVALTFQANYSNRSGGWNEFPDTGADHKVWYAGLSAAPEPLASLQPVTSGTTSGGWDILVPKANPVAGSIDLVAADLQVREV